MPERPVLRGDSVWVWPALVNAVSTWTPVQPELFHHLDWEKLIYAAEYHGVLPIVAQRILENPMAGEVELSVKDRLRRSFQANLLRVLPLADEVKRIASAFSDERIPIIPYKGPALAESLWGNSALRKCDDLDFLVERKNVDRAGKILDSMGYERVSPIKHHLRPALLRNASEEQFQHRETGLLLELQWSPAPRVFGIRYDADAIWPSAEKILFSDLGVLSPSPEDLLMLLSIHGWKHNWARLIWLGDIAQLTRWYVLDWNRLQARCKATRNLRLLALPLRMASHIFGAPLPQQFTFIDPELDALAQELEGRMRQANPCGYRDWHRCMLAARDTKLDRARQMTTFLFTPGLGDYAACDLPSWASAAYRAIRVGRLLTFGSRKCGVTFSPRATSCKVLR
jgi:hypothetical protein